MSHTGYHGTKGIFTYIFTYFYGFHVGKYTVRPMDGMGLMFIRACSRKNPKDETTYNSVVKVGDLDDSFSNTKTWGPCGVLAFYVGRCLLFFECNRIKWARYNG